MAAPNKRHQGHSFRIVQPNRTQDTASSASEVNKRIKYISQQTKNNHLRIFTFKENLLIFLGFSTHPTSLLLQDSSAGAAAASATTPTPTPTPTPIVPSLTVMTCPVDQLRLICGGDYHPLRDYQVHCLCLV